MALDRRGKILYSFLFLVAVPASLVAWATATNRVVPLRLSPSPAAGVALALAGLLLLLLGMRDLWVHGGGLPMNAAPPPRYVIRGAYALVPHPIYTGFCMVCAGVSILVGSASGLWLVTPVTMLACAALVMGYERHDLRERFGQSVRPMLPADASRPTMLSRARCLLLVVIPWLGLCGAVHLLGGTRALLRIPGGASIAGLPVLVCESAFVALAIAPFVTATKAKLRLLVQRSFLAIAFACLFFLAAPLGVEMSRACLPASIQNSFLRSLVAAAHGPQQVDAYFPSFTIVWALLVASGMRARGFVVRAVIYVWPALVCASFVIVSRGGMVPFAGALLAVVLAVQCPRLWEVMRAGCEGIANSWKEWHVGPVRILNHGVYVGLGGFISLALGGVLAGPGHETAIFLGAMLAVLGAALWAQFVEGSPQMLRPFGFYGGLLGGALGALIAPLFHTSAWLLLAVFSAIGSFGQALGRVRCLVQGCCHGRPGPAAVGIRYLQPSSRVCRFTGWSGVPLHATPLYSVLWNAVIAMVELRLWTLHASLPLITGMYFMLNGLGRFVEESYRGEPQTRMVAGLRLYQWAAITSFLLGALLTAAPGAFIPAPAPSLRWDVLPVAILFGVCVGGVMSVDFPRSNRRFARLL